ncbi:MAG: c-type cytochrome [Bryobacteraceae bacterium]
MLRTCAVVLAAALILPAQEDEPKIPKENPHKSAADIERGKKLFGGQCASCHGPLGEGGRGVNLARPTLPRAPDDPALFRTIRNGIEGTEMPGAWVMIDREVWQVAAFVRTLGRARPETVAGDPARGAALYRGKGNYAQCHALHRTGGRMGPDLTEIGARRSAAYLRESLVKPEAAAPEGFMQVRLTTAKGQSLTGVRLGEDTFSVQVRDLTDNLHSFWRRDLKDYRREQGKSPMPSYSQSLTASELDDLVAYLVSLRGKS